MTLVLVSGCTATPEQTDPPPPALTSETSPTVTGSATSPPTSAIPSTTEPDPEAIPPLEEVPPYAPAENEVLRERKELGGRFAQAVLTYEAGTTAAEHAVALSTAFGRDFTPGEIAEMVEAIRPEMDSVGTVRYVQMGGNRPNKAALMVWVDTEMQSQTGERISESRVLDVRVREEGDDLVVDEFVSAGGPAVAQPAELSELATAVLQNAGITLPDSARWDIYAGHTTDTMLQRMLEVAERHTYSVLVLNRGHPYFVFDTDSVSRHTVGQAMDVYEVDGVRIVDSRFEGSPGWNLSRELFDSGIRSIGSPWAFDGFGGRSFTDDVHQDHLHITGY